jgi:hypothetical protein
MMDILKHTVLWIATDAYVQAHEQPVYFHERPVAHKQKMGYAAAETARLGEFWVPYKPVLSADEDLDWSLTRTGDKVAIPVNAYKVNRALGSLFGFGIQVGVNALRNLQQRTKDTPTELILVVGQECTDLYPEPFYRCFLGLGIRTK